MKTKKMYLVKNFALLAVAFLLSITSFNLLAQDNLKRPKNIGDPEYDNFKNSSFNIYFNLKKYRKSIDSLDTNISSYMEDSENVSLKTLKEDKKSAQNLVKSVKKLKTEFQRLDDRAKTLAKNAKSIAPKTKSVKAVKNTNKSIKALNESKKMLSEELELLEGQITKLTELITEKGGEE